MSVIQNNLLMTPEGYQISRSVRLRSSASAYFNRTPASAGNRKTWTWSGWVKRGALGSNAALFGNYFAANDSSQFYISFNTSNQLQVGLYTTIELATSAVYRDTSAWYHVVCLFDSTQATASNRLRLFVNGSEVTAFATDNRSGLTLNGDFAINAAQATYIGYNNVSGYYFDGYLTEVNFIDGQALTPSSFGETDAITGVWKPKKYAGTYGTNGFYLNFSDNSNNTAATIGKDYSGNGNNWTPNNISVTSGVTYDSMLDTPTPYADGGNGRGNYAVLNPLKTTKAPTEGNLAVIGASGSYVDSTYGTIGVTGSGKYYFEVTGCFIAGFNISDINPSTNQTTGRLVYHGGLGSIYDGASAVQTGLATVTSTDVVGIALNLDAGTLAFYKNNSQLGTNVSVSASNTWWPFIESINTYTSYVNFGQRPFAYTPPTGFKALNTQNLPESTIKKGNQYFDSSLYTGNGTSVSVTNSGAFQPDFVWLKQRSGANQHNLMDAVRGAAYRLRTDATNAEEATPGTFTFDASGFTANTTNVSYNTSGGTYVAWQWKESATAGFDIVTWTQANPSTLNHSLGVTPSMIIIKGRGTTDNWVVWHKSLTNTTTYALQLNTTTAQFSSTSLFNSTAPTSTQFTVGTGSVTNATLAVAYLFAEVAGFSRFGSYTGNGSADGPFVYLGFRPRYVMLKNSSVTGGWVVYDTSRDTYNANTLELYPNLSNAEGTGSNNIDVLSNGFKVRGSAGYSNGSGNVIIYAAFSENPFKVSLAR